MMTHATDWQCAHTTLSPWALSISDRQKLQHEPQLAGLTKPAEPISALEKMYETALEMQKIGLSNFVAALDILL